MAGPTVKMRIRNIRSEFADKEELSWMRPQTQVESKETDNLQDKTRRLYVFSRETTLPIQSDCDRCSGTGIATAISFPEERMDFAKRLVREMAQATGKDEEDYEIMKAVVILKELPPQVDRSTNLPELERYNQLDLPFSTSGTLYIVNPKDDLDAEVIAASAVFNGFFKRGEKNVLLTDSIEKARELSRDSGDIQLATIDFYFQNVN